MYNKINIIIMIYTKKESLEDKLVRYLVNSSKTIHGINDDLKKEKVKATNQGIYKSLRFLIREEVVIKNKDIYSLSEEWKNKLLEDFSNTNGFDLSEHEQIQFNLSSLIHLDQQWKNIAITLQRNLKDFPIFFYNPHDIWPLLSESRKKSEEIYYKNLEKEHIYTFCVNGGNNDFDKIIKKERETSFNKINLNDKIFKNTDYITIIGDYITTVRINKKKADTLEKYFKESKNYEEFKKEIQLLGIEKKKVKLIVERNKEKAKRIRKRISKDFLITKELKEKFNLF